jgi:hypothetical protein
VATSRAFLAIVLWTIGTLILAPPLALARGGGSGGHSGHGSGGHSAFGHSHHSGRLSSHLGSFGHHSHHHHFHDTNPVFLEFFFPAVLGSPYLLDTWQDWYLDQAQAWGPFEPYYSPWARVEGQDYYVCEYYLDPEEGLSVVAYPDEPNLLYYYDPYAEQYIGILERSTGNFRYWLADEDRWSDPVTFPFSQPAEIVR